jgi:spermidine/putrescine ABC transporter ATP-binding subunit
LLLCGRKAGWVEGCCDYTQIAPPGLFPEQLFKLRLDQVVKRYEADSWQLQLDLQICTGEILTLLGPSGCGKTTTLRMIAGFITPDAGQIWLDQTVINDLPPQRRNMGVVFQDYALFPHLDVFHNIAFGMRMRRTASRAQIKQRVTELLALGGLEGYAHRHPDQLSGGEQQRIALLRALAPRPDILLLDEPLSALDFQLRKRLRQEIKSIQRQLGITMLYVTHDQEEALSISDRIAVMRNGAIEQIGTPAGIYQHPETAYVAQFVGLSNVLSGTLLETTSTYCIVAAAGQNFKLPAQTDRPVPAPITFFFRPEDVALTDQPGTGNAIRGTIVAHEYLGAEIVTHIVAETGYQYTVSNYIQQEKFLNHEGQPVWMNFPPEACKVVQGAAT